MIAHRLTFSVFMISAAALFASAPARAQEGPPVPPLLTAIEFFQPTPKAYSIESDCGGSPFVLRWEFDGRTSRVTHLSFGEIGDVENAELLGLAMGEIGGDIFVRSNCSPAGVEIRASEAWPRGSGRRQVLFNINDGELRELDRYNFDAPDE